MRCAGSSIRRTPLRRSTGNCAKRSRRKDTSPPRRPQGTSSTSRSRTPRRRGRERGTGRQPCSRSRSTSASVYPSDPPEGKMPGLGSRCEAHLLSEAFELGDEPADLALGVTAGVVVAAEVVVDLAGLEHVPAGADDRVLDGADRAAVPELGLLATVQGLQVAAVGSDRREGSVFQRDVQPFAAFAGAAGAALAGGL